MENTYPTPIQSKIEILVTNNLGYFKEPETPSTYTSLSKDTEQTTQDNLQMILGMMELRTQIHDGTFMKRAYDLVNVLLHN